MIESLLVRNFQSHKHSKLDFSPRVNVIIGPSRHGKTVLFRALKWVIENRPSGDEFRSHWAGKNDPLAVTLSFDNGESVERFRAGQDNRYSLNAQPFFGFGQDVPLPVKQALNLSDLNCQFQFDSPFLLFDSPGHVARFLNQVVHLDSIDTALANINSMKRQAEQEARSEQNRLANLEELERSFPDLVVAEEYIAELESQQRELNTKIGRRESLLALQNRLRELDANLQEVRLPEGIEGRIAALAEKHGHLERLRYTKDALVKIQGSLLAFRMRMVSLMPIIGKAEAIEILVLKNGECQRRKKALARLRRLSEQILATRQELAEKLAIIKQDEKKLKKLMPRVCPLCGK